MKPGIPNHFLSVAEIVFDIVTYRVNEDNGRAIAADFKPEPSWDPVTKAMTLYGQSQLGRWIRNTYRLWDTANPLVEAGAAPDSPKHPDNLSGEIMELVRAHFKAKYPEQVYAPRGGSAL